jgi:hypothetical protein
MKKHLRLILLITLYACHAASGGARAFQNEAEANKPTLNIVGASAEGIKLNRNSSSFSYLFTVEATKDAVTGVRVAVAPFMGPDGVLAETQCEINNRPCNAGPVDVPALDSIQIKVTATFPLEGIYTSAITLTYGSERKTTPFSVTRTRAGIPVEVLGVETVREEPILWSGAKTIWLTLSGTSGAESFHLLPPSPVALALEGPNNSRLQTPLSSVTVTDEGGQKVTQPFTLKSGETRRYKMTIEGLSDAGQYTGTLRVGALDAQPIDKPITFVVKASAFCAALLIGVGVLVGYLLRRYGTRDRPRLLQQRRLLVLASEVNVLEREVGQLNDDEKGIFALIRRWINDLYEDVQVGVVKDADAAVELLDKKLTLIPLWVNVRRRVEAVRPPELAEPFRARLDAVRNILREKQPALDALKQAQASLDALPGEIDNTVKDDLTKRLNDFKAEVEQFRDTVTDQKIRDAIRDKVETARARAAADVAAGRFDSARADFNDARGEYARLLADNLRASLDNASLPPGFDNAQWQALKSDVAAHLDQVSKASDPEVAIAAYRSAYTSYLQKLAVTLRGEVEQRLALLKAQADKFTEEDLKRHTADLNEIFKQLDDVTKRLAAGELTEAAGIYQQAKDALTRIVGALKAGGMAMGASVSDALVDALPAGAIPRSGGELPTVAVLGREPRERPTVESLTRRLRWYDLGVTFIIFLVAVVLGLYLLWINNPTWGGWGDRLTAVLWGLGLHQVAGAPVDVSGLHDKLTSPSAATGVGGGT